MVYHFYSFFKRQNFNLNSKAQRSISLLLLCFLDLSYFAFKVVLSIIAVFAEAFGVHANISMLTAIGISVLPMVLTVSMTCNLFRFSVQTTASHIELLSLAIIVFRFFNQSRSVHFDRFCIVIETFKLFVCIYILKFTRIQVFLKLSILVFVEEDDLLVLCLA